VKNLYEDLLQQGKKSPVDALKSGAFFEETSIIDLRRGLSETKNQDIISVYGGLLAGSEKHLRIYVNALKDQRISYSPKRLNQKDFDEIMKGVLIV
jgi:hypothetical protein